MADNGHTFLREGARCMAQTMGQRFLVTIREARRDTVWVTFPGRGYPPVGTGVDLVFHDEQGTSVYHTQVVGVPREMGAGLVLRRAPSLTRRMHRQHWRVPLEVYGTMLVDGVPEPIDVVIVNVSDGGACVEARDNVAQGSRVVLAFMLPGFEQRRYPSQVIYAGRSPQRGYRFGLHFGKLLPRTRRALTEFLWTHLQQQRADEVSAMYPGSKRAQRAEAAKEVQQPPA